MDRTETYIKMADCEEIQKIWHSKELRPDRRYHDSRALSHHYEKGYDGSFYWSGGEDVCCVDYEYESFYKETDIWLPRQDQLQEMVRGERSAMQMALWMASEYLIVNSPAMKNLTGDASMEQLWLAFVMKEKYNKVWGGEEWIKTDKP